MAAVDPHAMTYLPPTYSTRHTLVNSNDRNLSLAFFVHEDWVGIMLEDSMPYRPFMCYTCKLWDEPLSSFQFRISTYKPRESIDIGEARRVWEALVRDHGWSRVGEVAR